VLTVVGPQQRDVFSANLIFRVSPFFLLSPTWMSWIWDSTLWVRAILLAIVCYFSDCNEI